MIEKTYTVSTDFNDGSTGKLEGNTNEQVEIIVGQMKNFKPFTRITITPEEKA